MGRPLFFLLFVHWFLAAGPARNRGMAPAIELCTWWRSSLCPKNGLQLLLRCVFLEVFESFYKFVEFVVSKMLVLKSFQNSTRLIVFDDS